MYSFEPLFIKDSCTESNAIFSTETPSADTHTVYTHAHQEVALQSDLLITEDQEERQHQLFQ